MHINTHIYVHIHACMCIHRPTCQNTHLFHSVWTSQNINALCLGGASNKYSVIKSTAFETIGMHRESSEDAFHNE